MLLPRLITAILGIPLIIFSIYWGELAFFLMMFGVVFFSLKEYFILISHAGYENQPVIGMITGLVLFVSIYLNEIGIGVLANNQGTAALLSIMLIPYFVKEVAVGNVKKSIERVSLTFFGAFFIPWTLGHLLLIRNLRPLGMYYVYFLFIIIWILDTGAYIFGKRFGKHSLSVSISPKKTIEGAIGGVLTGILSSVVFSLMISHFSIKNFFTIPESIAIGFFISIISQFSDLSESLIKRDAGVKDSAKLLPGHGGMLDRFDSFLFAAPFLYYYILIIKGI